MIPFDSIEPYHGEFVPYRLQTPFLSPIGQRVIDFTLSLGNKIANLEIKYRIPDRAGDALNRLVGQMNAMITKIPIGEQPVVWTLKEPTIAQLQRLQNVAGPDVFNQIQFVSGISGLYYWIKLYFGI